MTTLLLLLMLMLVGFIGLCYWLGKQAAQNPAAATEMGMRLGKWFLK